MAELPPGFVLDQTAAMPDGFVLDSSGHQVAGPSDNPIRDIPRRLGTAAINTVLGLVSPFMGRGGYGITPGASDQPWDRNTLSGGGVNYQAPLSPEARKAELARIRDAAFNKTSVTEYQPETFAGRVTQAGLEGLTGGALFGGPLINAVSAAGGQTAAETLPINPVAASLMGQLATGYGASKMSNALMARSPAGMDPETAALAQVGVDNNIPVPVGKASDSRVVKTLDSVARSMPMSGYGKQDQVVQDNWTKAVTKAFGEDAPKVTPKVINQAYDRIGGVFDDVASRTSVKLDQTLQNELARIDSLAANAGLDAAQVKAIKSRISQIWDAGVKNNGALSGDVYQNITKRGEALDVLQGNRSTTTGQLAGQIRDALDDALERSATSADVAALREARAQYKALKTVEPLTLRSDTVGGVTPSTGEISPAALLGRVNQQYKNAARAEIGEIPLLDLARFGQRFVKEPSSSNTPERLMAQRLIGAGPDALATLASGGALMAGANPYAAALTAAAGMAAPRLIGSALRAESPVRRQIGAESAFDLNRQALIAALRAEQVSNALANPGGRSP